jgi:enterochelin esterase-like enzyme
MNICKPVIGWISVFVLLGLAGCQAAAPVLPTVTPFQPAPATATPLPSPTPAPTFTPTPLPSPTPLACLAQSGRIEQHTQADGAPLPYRIYLPPCYDDLPDRKYPVLYMLHGQTYTDDQWDRLGMDEAAGAMIQAGEAPPFLIVMPLEANTLGDVFVTQYGKHVAEELVPWIDAHFATCPERACRAIGGLSRGGAWALNTGFDYWELFSAVGLHSTPPFITGSYRVHQWMKQIPADQLPRLWLDTGRTDWYIKYTTDLEAWLTAEGMPHEWTLYDGTHDEAYWSSHVGDYLVWYTQPWKERFPILP